MHKRSNTSVLVTKKPRALSRAGKVRQAPTYNPYKPWNATVVGIDPGEVSGYSLWIAGKYKDSKVVKNASMKSLLVAIAHKEAIRNGLPLVFVAEDWPKNFLPNRKRMSGASIRGMGANWGKWLHEIEKIIDENNIKIHVLRVASQKWRKQFSLEKLPKNQAKAMALSICKLSFDRTINDHNQAEATLIGKYGCFCGELSGTGLRRLL